MAAKDRTPVYANTVEIDFGQRFSVTALEVHKWFRSINIPSEHVGGFGFIRQANRRVFVVKFTSEQQQRLFLDEHEGVKSITIESGQVEVSIGMPSIRVTTVRLYDVPFEATRNDIVDALNKYGDVSRVRFNKSGGGEIQDYYNVPDGTVTVGMALKQHIPSAIRIRGVRALVHYPTQPKTCFICGNTGHMTNQCPNKNKGTASAVKFPGKWAQPTAAQQETTNEPNDFPELPNAKPSASGVNIFHKGSSDHEAKAPAKKTNLQTQTVPRRTEAKAPQREETPDTQDADITNQKEPDTLQKLAAENSGTQVSNIDETQHSKLNDNIEVSQESNSSLFSMGSLVQIRPIPGKTKAAKAKERKADNKPQESIDQTNEVSQSASQLQVINENPRGRKKERDSPGKLTNERAKRSCSSQQ